LKTFDPGQRARRLGTALLLLLLPVLPAQARGRSEAWANTQFSTAERMRETLNALPATERSRHEYQRVINAYRRVYYGAPASAKADPSVVTVADVLAEMGRCFNNDNDLRSAIGQYKFLRREYPGSRNRFEALFNIAQIYQDDLKQPAEAKPIFEEFLRRYPRNHLADAARSALDQPVQQAGLRSKVITQLVVKESDREGGNGDDADDDSSAPKAGRPKVESHNRTAKPSHITNIRYWSSQNYTRVAIDLEQDTKFESQRIDNPERIFFDLLNTNLVSKLLGKTFDVDDGLLKKIRVAQFQPGKSRIVLEVADRSDCDTFLLANPPRLIIDIHSRDINSRDINSKDIQGKDIRLQDSSDQAKGSESKPPIKAQGVQPASLKQTAPLNSGSTKIADTPIGAKSEDSTGVEAKLPVAATTKSRVPLTRVASGAGPRKTVVEADDSDDDSAVTVAKLDPPDVKSPARAAGTLAPPASKSSATNKRKNAESFPDVREASPTASGDRSLIRALGLKIGRIVIDPGHGGHDTGTIGPNGLEEKDLVLDVGRRLGKLLQARLGADVVYTRKDDTFIPLETRTSIANQEQADLFVSIHANSSRDADARGVETYYLNFTSSAEALDVAARENAASDKSVYELQDLVKKIALKEKIEESREFASNVQRALHSGLAAKSPGIRDRGVKKAPFIVLIGANMPSILAEISFVSNPGDERRLRTPDYRQRIAESLYRGISKYVSGLSGVKVAAKIDKGEGQ
jgi:N-acetylmuramoyl-L-alanine amidase